MEFSPKLVSYRIIFDHGVKLLFWGTSFPIHRHFKKSARGQEVGFEEIRFAPLLLVGFFQL